MSIPARLYTPAEAAALSGIGIKAVHNAIDKRSSRLSSAWLAQAPRAQQGRPFAARVGFTLAASRRQRLFEEIKAAPRAKTVKADDLLIDVEEARKQLKARMSDLVATMIEQGAEKNGRFLMAIPACPPDDRIGENLDCGSSGARKTEVRIGLRLEAQILGIRRFERRSTPANEVTSATALGEIPHRRMPAHSLVAVAETNGHEAKHVNWLGLNGRPDWALMRRIVDED